MTRYLIVAFQLSLSYNLHEELFEFTAILLLISQSTYSYFFFYLIKKKMTGKKSEEKLIQRVWKISGLIVGHGHMDTQDST
jgi:hypothetical protein